MLERDAWSVWRIGLYVVVNIISGISGNETVSGLGSCSSCRIQRRRSKSKYLNFTIYEVLQNFDGFLKTITTERVSKTFEKELIDLRKL